jgi:hypothetical protein
MVRPDVVFPWYYYFCGHRDYRMDRCLIYKEYIDKDIIWRNKYGQIYIRSIKGDKEFIKLKNIFFKEIIN